MKPILLNLNLTDYKQKKNKLLHKMDGNFMRRRKELYRKLRPNTESNAQKSTIV